MGRNGVLTLRALCFAVSLAVSLNVLSKEPLASLERISFSSFRPDGWNIWLLSPNKPPQRLTDHPALDYDPAWSPDGRYIVFTSERSGVPDLFVMESIEDGARAAAGYRPRHEGSSCHIAGRPYLDLRLDPRRQGGSIYASV